MNKARHCWWCCSRPREELLGLWCHSLQAFTNTCRKARTGQETHYAVTGHSEGGNDCRRWHPYMGEDDTEAGTRSLLRQE